MKIVVIGATSAIAGHCCRLWTATETADFVLMARDTTKLEKIAADLTVRGAHSISLAAPEFFNPAAINAFADATVAAGPVDGVLIAHGWLSDQQSCQNDLAFCRQSLLRRGHAASLRRQRREDRADQARPDRHADDGGAKGPGPAQVARETVDGIRRGRPMVYTPPMWWPIMLIARHIPRFVFNRLSV